MSSTSASGSVSVAPVMAGSGRAASCARSSGSFRLPSSALPIELECSGLNSPGLGRVADRVRAFHHLQVDHRIALALAEDHGFARGVAHALQHWA